MKVELKRRKTSFKFYWQFVYVQGVPVAIEPGISHIVYGQPMSAEEKTYIQPRTSKANHACMELLLRSRVHCIVTRTFGTGQWRPEAMYTHCSLHVSTGMVKDADNYPNCENEKATASCSHFTMLNLI